MDNSRVEILDLCWLICCQLMCWLIINISYVSKADLGEVYKERARHLLCPQRVISQYNVLSTQLQPIGIYLLFSFNQNHNIPGLF